MPLNNQQRNMALAGSMISIAAVTSLFVFSPGLAVVIGGIFALCGFIFYDRVIRRAWEESVSTKLQKLDSTTHELAGEIRHTAHEVTILRDQIKENTKARSPSRRGVNIPRTLAAPSLAAGKLASLLPDDDLNDNTMPFALRAGTASNQTFESAATETGTDISDPAVKQLLAEALRNQKIDLFLQPVMKLPQRKVRFYEMFARVRARPGVFLPAERYMKLADAPAVREIDRLLLTDCLELLRTTAGIERAAPFFINVTQASLRNTAFMKKLLAFLATHRDLAARLIFELRQDEYKSLDPAVGEVMKAMAKLGCSFSIDNVRAPDFDMTALLRLNIRYIKIPAKNFLPALRSARELAELTRIKRKLEGNSIAIIVEKIEDEPTLRELSDFDISYGQGFLFGRPDLQGAYQGKTERARRSS